VSKSIGAPHEHWYSGIAEAVMTYIPGNSVYRTMRARNARHGTLFILPLIIGFLVFMVRPLAESFYMSLSKITIQQGGGYLAEFVGLQNYKYAFTMDASYNTLLVEEIGRMAVNTIATLVMSFVIAVILNQEFKGRTLCRAIFFLPVILSSGVLPGIESQNEFYNMMASVSEEAADAGLKLSESLQELLSVSGVGNQVFEVVFTMIDQIYDIVMASGIQIIVFISGLQTIPDSLYEASAVEGCSPWESFWKITFPMVSPLLLVNCIYTIIDFFMKNDNKVMERINLVMYQQFKFGESSAMSWIYFGVAVVFIAISSFIISKGVHYYED